MKYPYQSVFFDLDNTLWDFRSNSRKAFRILYRKYCLAEKGISFDRFERIYHHFNDQLWEAYREGQVDKETLRWKRFYMTLADLGVPDKELSYLLDDDYIETSKTMTGLVEGALDILDYLKPTYRLFLLTNGFNEVQFTKIRNSGLAGYFEKTITSEIAGFLKPHRSFFEYALKETASDPDKALMIGDNPETDIRGAAAAGIDTVFYNPSATLHDCHPVYEVNNLNELRNIL